MILQPILDLASICAQKDVNNVILSPGSRCAPLTLAFARHPEIHCRTIADERSAAFVALGMAQQLQKPVVLVCTSGSAVLNYGPAVAEAYFQQIPLIIITADRPAEWIDQWDGQTIRQSNNYGSHVKGSFSFPDEFSHKDKIWHAHRISNEAINLASASPRGPVHLNIPLREPFYPEKDEQFSYNPKISLISEVRNDYGISEEVKQQLILSLEKYRKILIVPGQQAPDVEIARLLTELVDERKTVVVADVISNMQSESTVTFHDFFLIGSETEDALAPDLIISFGKSIISKSLKLFLRQGQTDHWHIQPAGYAPDPYQQLTEHIHADPAHFLQFLSENTGPADASFYQEWHRREEISRREFPHMLNDADFGEFKALDTCLRHLPSPCKIHLSNSMPVRYANYIGIRNQEQEVVCNRGTSGIDGSNSTAVGCTFTTKEPVVLITGDMAFFYDRNAFWHNYTLPNLRIILLNNHAGGIFRMIKGPSAQPELEEYFETVQRLDASFLAREHNFDYFQVDEASGLEDILETFYQPSVKPKILEITSSSPNNAAILAQVKSSAKSIFGNIEPLPKD